MVIELTGETIITSAAVVGGLITLITLLVNGVRWFDRQAKQDVDLETLREHHNADISSIKVELELLVQGNLACLQGLKEQGCNGPVTATIKQYEEYLNKKAHE